MGLRRPLKGSVSVEWIDVSGLTPRKIRELGVAYVPEDPGSALVPDYPAFRNIIISPWLPEDMLGRGFSRVKEALTTLVKLYSIKIKSPEQITSTLSGGTKQKLVMGRELHIEPKILNTI